MFHQSPLAGCHMSLKGAISIHCINNSWAQNFNNHSCGRVLHFYSRLHSLFVCKAVPCKIICAVVSYGLNDATWINPQHVCILPGPCVWPYVSGIKGDSREANIKILWVQLNSTCLIINHAFLLWAEWNVMKCP